MDDAGNTFELQIKVKKAGKKLKAELDRATYTDGRGREILTFHENKLKIEYSVNKKTENVKTIKQKLEIKKQLTIKTEYNKEKDQTKIRIHPYKQRAEKYTVAGMWILKVTTSRGAIGYIPPI